MNNIADKTTFWSFLGQTDIIIPKLQRDYAQGRKGKESLRENFLASIKRALDSDKQLKLDFVYGTSDNGWHFTPLDGQQRLTTLWLIHWYLAFRTHNLEDQDTKKRLLHFTYETRISSRQFCEKLVKEGHKLTIQESEEKKENISDAILRQSWMYKAWKQDPTIQSMLRMLSGEEDNKLDGIEEIFNECDSTCLENYWHKLQKSAEECPIVFYSLDIENIGQSDDLYVKMNGRGKPLSDFENFKADLIKFCEEKGWSSFTKIETGFPVLMDTKWNDLFWTHRTSDSSTDDIFFSFINRFFLSRLLAKIEKIDEEIEKKENAQLKKAYNYLYSFTNEEHESYNSFGFNIYKTLFESLDAEGQDTWSLLYDLRTILNTIYNEQKVLDWVNNPYYVEDEFKLLYVTKKSIKNTQELTIPQIIAFWASCKYLSIDKPVDGTKFRQWMRVVWNMCDYNNEIRNISLLNSTIHLLDFFFYNPTRFDDAIKEFDIEKIPSEKISSLKSGDGRTALGEHLLEEQSKMNQMSNNNLYTGSIAEFTGKTWEEVIMSVERIHLPCNSANYILSGTIRCLIQNEKGEYIWDAFDDKYRNLKWYIDRNLDSIAYRNLLTLSSTCSHAIFTNKYWFDYIGPFAKHLSFWRNLFAANKQDEYLLIHSWLCQNPLDENGLKSQQIVGQGNYHLNQMIQTSLIEEVQSNDGIYLAWSDKNKAYVLFHHQRSIKPYILFQEDRNKTLVELYNNGTIQFTQSDTLLKCNLLQGRDIEFIYNNETFIWTGDSLIILKSDKEGLHNTKIRPGDNIINILNTIINNIP